MIEGFAIGHHTADGDGWLTGTTVVLARRRRGRRGRRPRRRSGHPGDRPARPARGDRAGACRGADRRQRVRAGRGGRRDGRPGGCRASASRSGRDPGQVVPIVPAAVIFDLGRGGDFGHRPTAEFGARALAAASTERPESGCVGAGTGAVCGGLKGGFGYAEHRLDSGVIGGRGRRGQRHRLAGRPGHRPALRRPRAPAAGPDRGRARRPGHRVRERLSRRWPPPSACVLTDATLTKAQAGQGGRGRPRRDGPGDRAGALDAGRRHRVRPGVRAAARRRRTRCRPWPTFNRLLAAAADVFTDACLDAVCAAERPRRLALLRRAGPVDAAG